MNNGSTKYPKLEPFGVGIWFALENDIMKRLSERMWSLILGIAVAIIVALTTLSWNSPVPPQKANIKSGISNDNATIHKIAVDFLRFVATHARHGSSVSRN